MNSTRAETTRDAAAAFAPAMRALSRGSRNAATPRDGVSASDTALQVAVERGVRSADVREPHIDAFTDSLRADDLVLAAARAPGISRAWAHLIETLRPRIYSVAGARSRVSTRAAVSRPTRSGPI